MGGTAGGGGKRWKRRHRRTREWKGRQEKSKVRFALCMHVRVCGGGGGEITRDVIQT